MKFNFGYGLFIGAILFMTFVVVLVVNIMKTDVPLVEENYYEKGIKYQEMIDMSNNKDLAIKITTGFAENNNKILKFSKTTTGDTIYGKAYFYRASDKNKDLTIDVMLADTFEFPFDISFLDKGVWKVKFSYQSKDGNAYYLEKDFVF